MPICYCNEINVQSKSESNEYNIPCPRAKPTPPYPAPPVILFEAELTGQCRICTVDCSSRTDQNEIPANNSTANGRLTGSLSNNKTKFDFIIRTNGLTNIRAVSLCLGYATETGIVVKTIPINQCTNTWALTDTNNPLTPELAQALSSGRIYVNISTTKFPNGEIRGQIQPVYLNNTHEVD